MVIERRALHLTSTHAPLYERVRVELMRIALERALTDTTPLPAEPRLMEQFRVSRGTLRRAIDALVREGVLYTEQGRGTFVNQEERVRRVVFDHLRAVAVPDSRSDLDVRSFVPDFDGREGADRSVLALPEWAEAKTLFVMPDNSLRQLRLYALEHGKRILVPTFNFRRGLVLLDGAALRNEDKPLAATLDGMEQLGTRITPRDLASFHRVDLVVTGATAVATDGRAIGRGEPYLALGWALLEALGVVDDQVRVVAVVHDCQVIDSAVPAVPECTVDVVITPTRVIRCASPPAPRRRATVGIARDRLYDHFDAVVPTASTT